MIFKFRIVSDEVNNFKREIEIDAANTFLDLKNAICDCVGYDKNEMSSFCICDDDWETTKEITLMDMGVDPDQDFYLMDECVLSDYLDDKGQKLTFVFDYMTDRRFFMELKDAVPGKVLKDPVCTLSLGQAPAQTIDLDEFTKEVDKKAASTTTPDIDDIGEDLYGSDEFNDDEFDMSGYSELTEDM